MKKIFSTLFLLCIFAGIVNVLGKATLNRTTEGCIQLSDFYELEEDTVDVLFVGSSHVYYSINTCLLYDNYGMASYLLASPGQPVWISYYFLEEALKTQSPRLVVLDVCTLYHKGSDVGASSWPSLISMKPSLVKWKAICAVNQEEQLLDGIGAFFPFPYYHTRYAQLTRQDYENTKLVRYNGYKPDFNVISQDELAEWADTDQQNFGKIEPVSERTETYLRKLIELCQDKAISVLLVNSPYLNQTEEKQQAYNYIGTIAREYGIPFIDSNFVEEIQIDFKKDLLEASHLNYYGSVKYTDYLAQWIKRNQHDKIPDRRGDMRYHAWEEASQKLWHVELSGRGLKEIHTLSAYWEAVQRLEECVVAVYQKPEGRAVVYDNGEAVFAGAAGEAYFKHLDLGHSDLAVRSGDEGMSVLIDRKEYSFVENGVNILVYDKVAKDVVDGVGFDAGRGFKAVRK